MTRTQIVLVSMLEMAQLLINLTEQKWVTTLLVQLKVLLTTVTATLN